MKSVPQGGIKWRPGGEILWNSRQVGSRNMRVGKRSICGIMVGILFMMEPVSGYGMMREGTWKNDIRNQIMEIQQMQTGADTVHRPGDHGIRPQSSWRHPRGP